MRTVLFASIAVAMFASAAPANADLFSASSSSVLRATARWASDKFDTDVVSTQVTIVKRKKPGLGSFLNVPERWEADVALKGEASARRVSCEADQLFSLVECIEQPTAAALISNPADGK